MTLTGRWAGMFAREDVAELTGPSAGVRNIKVRPSATGRDADRRFVVAATEADSRTVITVTPACLAS